jgi:hypothetical protein
MNATISGVEWLPVEQAIRPFALEATVSDDARLMRERLKLTGLPQLTGSFHDKAVSLLKIAAEVEHAFIVQYLFGAYSLNTTDPNAQKWYGVIRGIAKEEMGHLITVQNLLALLGAPPYLVRQTYPAPPTYPFEKTLKPFALKWLGDFAIAESPLGATLPQGLNPAGDPLKVGTIYMYLYWIFKDSDQPGPPWPISNPGVPPEHLANSDFADVAYLTDRLMNPDDWGGRVGTDPPGQPSVGIKLLASGPFNDAGAQRQGALDAIYDIAAQGEGPLPMANSHFDRLCVIYTRASPIAPLPVKVIAENPHTTLQTNSDPETEPGLITHPIALGLAMLLNFRYAMLLAEIRQTSATPRTVIVDNQPLRQTLSGWAMDNEMGSIETLSLALTSQPLKKTRTADSDLRAAPPFEPPAELPGNDHDSWSFYLDVFDRTKRIADQIGLQVPGLDTIVQDDDARRSFIGKRLA